MPLQDAIKVDQPGGPGKNSRRRNWDLASQKKVRDALLVLAADASPIPKRMFGPRAVG